MFVFKAGRRSVTYVPLETTRVSGLFKNGAPTRFQGHFENCLIASTIMIYQVWRRKCIESKCQQRSTSSIITVDRFMLKAKLRMLFKYHFSPLTSSYFRSIFWKTKSWMICAVVHWNHGHGILRSNQNVTTTSSS